MKILHIAAHLGAGAGKAISGLAIKLNEKHDNSVIILEAPAQIKYVEACRKAGIDVTVTGDESEIAAHISKSDIVVFSWWGHPLSKVVFDVLGRVKCNVVLWSHVNGLFYPKLRPEFITAFDGAMFTSTCSYDSESWDKDAREKMISDTAVIYGMGDFSPETQPYKTGYEDYVPDKEFHVCYSGTLGYEKISGRFPVICDRLLTSYDRMVIDLFGIPDGKLVNDIRKRTGERYERVRFHGFVNDLPKRLAGEEIFIYPLTYENYATTENAIVEAMASGLPVVVLDNPAERRIVENGSTGIVSRSTEEFCEDVEKLICDRGRREELGKRARAHAITEYDAVKNAEKAAGYLESRIGEKVLHEFPKVIGTTPEEVFLFQTGYDREEYVNKRDSNELPAVFYGTSKGSEQHFKKYFSDFCI